MYRAIRSTNGGEEVEYRNFNSLVDAYQWLQPTPWRQMRDGWHLKMFPAIKAAFTVNVPHNVYEMVGFDEIKQKPTFLYIQRVQAWNDALPSDL